jgi:hypothetical protein
MTTVVVEIDDLFHNASSEVVDWLQSIPDYIQVHRYNEVVHKMIEDDTYLYCIQCVPPSKEPRMEALKQSYLDVLTSTMEALKENP